MRAFVSSFAKVELSFLKGGILFQIFILFGGAIVSAGKYLAGCILMSRCSVDIVVTAKRLLMYSLIWGALIFLLLSCVTLIIAIYHSARGKKSLSKFYEDMAK